MRAAITSNAIGLKNRSSEKKSHNTETFVREVSMLSLLRQRRSIRIFKDKTIDPVFMDTLVECLLRSPSSRNIRPWEFIVVTDKALLDTLSRAKQHGSSFLSQAAAGIVVCAREHASDVWIEDCSIASTVVQLSAEAMGLGACWIQIRNRAHDQQTGSEEFIRNHLNIPDTLRVDSIIAIGHPAEKKAPHPIESLLYEKVHMNDFNRPYEVEK